MADERERAWSGAAAVELDFGLWEAVQAAADEEGLSIARYLDTVAGDAAEPGKAPEAVRRARLARLAAAARRSDALAVHAESEQAVRRAGAAATHSAGVLALRETGLGNIAYVRALWGALEGGGVAAMAALVPQDVRWRPLGTAGRVLRGTGELAEFWAARTPDMPTLRMFHRHGDDVLVEAEYTHADQPRQTIWLLYRFDGDRLIEAISFGEEAQARGYQLRAAQG